MKRTAKLSGWGVGLLTIALVAPVFGQAQRGVWESYEIQTLKAQLGALVGKRVQLIGHVSTVDPQSSGLVDRYILQGYRGGSLPVQFATERPLPTTHVFIRGIVNIDAMGEGYITEALRVPQDVGRVTRLIQDGIIPAIDAIGAGIDNKGVPPEELKVVSEVSLFRVTTYKVFGDGTHELLSQQTKWSAVGLVGVAAILVVTAIVILLIVAFKPKPQPVATPRPIPTPGPMIGAQGLGPGAAPKPEEDDEITIVRKGGEVRQIVDEKTVIPLPGWLEVLAGGKAVGNKIRLIGPQHALIGRKSKDSRGVNFIALEMDDLSETEKKTLSRKQVKVAYDKANDEFTVENVGTVGTSVWLDGGELASGHSAPLTDGMTLKMEPYWEFRFCKGRPA